MTGPAEMPPGRRRCMNRRSSDRAAGCTVRPPHQVASPAETRHPGLPTLLPALRTVLHPGFGHRSIPALRRCSRQHRFCPALRRAPATAYRRSNCSRYRSDSRPTPAWALSVTALATAWRMADGRLKTVRRSGIALTPPGPVLTPAPHRRMPDGRPSTARRPGPEP